MSPDSLRQACERAARYRRQLALEAGRPSGNLAEIIDVVPAYRVERTYPGGWVHAGYVADTDLSVMLEVCVHRDTGRVRVQSPRDVDDAPPVEPMPALSCALYGPRIYRADRRYRYWFAGVEYLPEDAERIATARGTAAGWTWSRRV